MKKQSRIIAALLTAMMLASLFAGCASSSGGAETSPTASTAAASQEATAEATAAEESTEAATDTASTAAWPANPLGTVTLPLTADPVTISLWMGVNPNVLKIINDPNTDCAIWAELASRTGVNVNFITCNPDTESEKFNLMIASDDLADVISNATSLYTNGGEAAISDGVLIDTLPYLTEENCPQICKLLDQYPDALTNGLTDSGWLAGLPQLSMQTEASQTFGPMIRQDWLDELGLDVPETYDDLYNVLCAFRDQKGADAALALNYAGTGINNGLVEGYGTMGLVADAAMTEPFYQVDGKMTYGPIQPEFKEYLTMINKWYSEGLIWQDFMSYSDFQNPPTDIILSDRCGMFYGEVTYMASLKASSTEPDFNLVAMPDIVQTAGGTIPFKEERDYTVATPWSISSACTCPDLVMQWCNYFYTDDGALLCNYGIEGKSFNFNESGTPVFTDLVLNNPDMNTTVALFMYCMDRGPFYRDETREQSSYTDAQKAASGIWQSNLSVGRSPGSYTLNTEESDAVNVHYSDIKTYIEESVLSFITGNTPLSEFDSYVQHIKDLGIADVTAEYQEAYDRYLSGDETDTATASNPGPPPDGAAAPPA